MNVHLDSETTGDQDARDAFELDEALARFEQVTADLDDPADAAEALNVLTLARRFQRKLAIAEANRPFQVRIECLRMRGRAPRTRTNRRTRGSRRTATRAGPSGDDPPGEPDLADRHLLVGGVR